MAIRNWDLKDGYSVYDETEDKLGNIGELADGYFQMDTGLLGLGRKYYIPYDVITDVRGENVYLRTTKERLDSLGWDERPVGRTDLPEGDPERGLGNPLGPTSLVGEPIETPPRDASLGESSRSYDYRPDSAATGGRWVFQAEDTARERSGGVQRDRPDAGRLDTGRTHGGPDDPVGGAGWTGSQPRERTGTDPAEELTRPGDEVGGLAPGRDDATYRGGTAEDEYEVDEKDHRNRR